MFKRSFSLVEPIRPAFAGARRLVVTSLPRNLCHAILLPSPCEAFGRLCAGIETFLQLDLQPDSGREQTVDVEPSKRQHKSPPSAIDEESESHTRPFTANSIV
jgi:hypothetical protein